MRFPPILREFYGQDTTRLKILIVEDELLVALDAEDMLREAGHEVVGIAASGEDAFRIASAIRPDLALLDMRLSGPLDGIDVATRLLGEMRIPVVFLTANPDLARVPRAASLGPIDVLSKPFTKDVLLAGVSRAAAREQGCATDDGA